MIALALSGGGSRAIAFHLGCMRALYDRGVLQKVCVISAVSGGSVIAGLYAYWDDSFEEFDDRVLKLLRRGLEWSAVCHLFSLDLFTRIIATNLISRPAAAVANLLHCEPPLRRWASRTDALEAALGDIFGNMRITQVARPNIDVVLNACELRTGTAFRFGNHRSGAWRFGEIENNCVSVAHAVACSAAYPMFLPAFDRELTFVKKDGTTQRERVVVTDGGVYDNLGISCLEPSRDNRFSLHVYPADYIICCYAGCGQLAGGRIPYGAWSRASAALEGIFRKVQDAGLHRLHIFKQTGNIKGFILPYLGQQDERLPLHVPGLVRREQVIGYPTNFAAMPQNDLDRLTRRGEQLTSMLLGYYCPEI